jgi:hypothetical protein
MKMSPSTSRTLTASRDMMPVMRGMSSTPGARGVAASDQLGCSLCHVACEAIHDAALRQACHLACNVSGICP